MLHHARTWLALTFDKRGVTALEYGIIAALMGSALAVAVPALSGNLGTAFTKIGATLAGAGS